MCISSLAKAIDPRMYAWGEKSCLRQKILSWATSTKFPSTITPSSTSIYLIQTRFPLVHHRLTAIYNSEVVGSLELYTSEYADKSRGGGYSHLSSFIAYIAAPADLCRHLYYFAEIGSA